MSAPTGYTAVSAAKLRDASGNLISNATAIFSPNQPFRVGGDHGQTVKTSVSVAVSNGALAINLADTSISSPQNVSYRLVVEDAQTRKVLLDEGYEQLQPSGPAWSLDDYVTPLQGLALQVAGKDFNFRGAWTPNTAYSSLDVLTFGGSTYLVANPFTSASAFDASTVTLMAAKGASGGVPDALVPAILPVLGNRFYRSRVTVDSVVSADTGQLVPLSGYKTTGRFYLGGGGPFVSSLPFGSYQSNGIAFFDSAGQFLSGLKDFGNPGPAHVFTAPDGAIFGQAWYPSSTDDSSAMIVLGNTLPVSYAAPFGEGLVDSVALAASQAASRAASSLASTLAVSSLGKLSANRFDPAKVVPNFIPDQNTGQRVPFNGFQSLGLMYFADSDHFYTNLPIGTYQHYGPCAYDGTGKFLGAIDTGGGTPAAGFKYLLPPGTVYVDAFLANSQDFTGAFIGIGAAVPASVPPYGLQISTATQLLAYAGVSFGHMGDSISYGSGSGVNIAPLIASHLGATLTFEISWPGRLMYQALSNSGNTGKPFLSQSVAQGLQVLCLWLSTNVDRSNIGTASDAPSVGTSNANGMIFPSTDSFASQTKGVIEQLLMWNPGLLIVLPTPYQSAHYNAGGENGGQVGLVPDADSLAVLLNISTVLKAVGQQYGMPVIDLYARSGLNKLNATTLLVDSLHPTADTQKNRLAPFLAHALEASSPR